MIRVIKANGEREEYSEEKLWNSARRAGIDKSLKADLLAHVKTQLRDDIPTSEIYHHILEYLGKASVKHVQAIYSLKQSIMDLGPTGYPFEDYVARILQAQGYSTVVRNIIKGKCISHEIDVIAEKNFSQGVNRMMVEAKYHNHLGVKTDVHVAMYTYARFQDTREQNNFNDVLLVTNTKATIDAISYADCAGMKIISWSHPDGGSLRDLVEKYSLHPITALTSLSLDQKQELLRRGIVLCKDICQNQDTLTLLRISLEQKQQIYEEALVVCSVERGK